MNDNTKRVMEGITKLQNKLEGEDKKNFIEIMFLFDRCAELLEITENENKKLNNVINELEKYIGQEYYCFDNESVEFEVAKNILDKLKELKGDSNE